MAFALAIGTSRLPVLGQSIDAPAEQRYSDSGSPPAGMRLPPNLPGASAPPIMLPPVDPKRPEVRREAIERLFPPLPAIPQPIHRSLGPNERPLTLNDLENLATGTSPIIRQAEAEISAARGHAIQEGTHPNPLIGYEGDTVGSSGNPNYHGAYFNQLIKTAGKLQLAQAAAMIDVRNGQLGLRKARVSLIAQVQSRYYAVLVAEESVRVNEALARFTEEVYRIQIEQLRGGEAAAYEPMQSRVLALEARTALIQARNRYFSAWNQLVASVNAPNLPPTQLAGNPNILIPPLRFDLLRTVIWEQHPDVLAARNSTEQARINLRFAEITPIPDINLYSALQKDYTTGSPGASFNIQVGLPVPIFDRNLGGIAEAQGLLIKAEQENIRIRNELTAVLADAFERYENNRAILEYYRVSVLPDQARAYRGTYLRHQQQPDRVGFADIVVAQQVYAGAIANYITALGGQWIAVTDLLNTVQIEDLTDLQSLMDRLGRDFAPLEMVPPPPPNLPAGPLPGGRP